MGPARAGLGLDNAQSAVVPAGSEPNPAGGFALPVLGRVLKLSVPTLFRVLGAGKGDSLVSCRENWTGKPGSPSTSPATSGLRPAHASFRCGLSVVP